MLAKPIMLSETPHFSGLMVLTEVHDYITHFPAAITSKCLRYHVILTSTVGIFKIRPIRINTVNCWHLKGIYIKYN